MKHKKIMKKLKKIEIKLTKNSAYGYANGVHDYSIESTKIIKKLLKKLEKANQKVFDLI